MHRICMFPQNVLSLYTIVCAHKHTHTKSSSDELKRKEKTEQRNFSFVSYQFTKLSL